VLTITRTFEARPSVVFKLWTESHHVKRWWESKGFVALSFEIDVRPRGAWNCCLRSLMGLNCVNAASIAKSLKQKKLSFTYAADQYRWQSWPFRTMDFTAFGARPESLFAKGLLNRSWPAMSKSAAGRAVWSVSPST
jgi:uncharacterized protein YndB with AHSA1/START domain